MTTPTRWVDLRRFTTARVALGRAGNGLPTAPHLAFQAAHAAARDAVHAALDPVALATQLAAEGIASLTVRSQCPDRRTYLLRPDLGRLLHPDDAATLPPTPGCIAFAVFDGLSSLAVERHAPALLARLIPALRSTGIAVPPVVLANQGRVALGDPIGAALGAEAIIVLLGERPGLSTPDSLGAYLTWQPRPGRSDAERNCISNIHANGLTSEPAAAKLLWLIAEMRRLRLTGVELKDEQPAPLSAIAG